MAEKTAKRRLARIFPFEINEGRFLKAARLDEAHDEQGLYSHQGTVITEPESSIAPRVEGTPSMQQMTGPKADPELERLKSKATSFPSLSMRSTRASATCGRQHGTESATLQSLQVKQQLGVQALSIANSAPSIMLSLFR